MIHPNVVVQSVLVNSLSSRTCPRRTVHAADFEQEQMTRSDPGLVGFEDHEVQRDRDQDSCRNCGRSVKKKLLQIIQSGRYSDLCIQNENVYTFLI